MHYHILINKIKTGHSRSLAAIIDIWTNNNETKENKRTNTE
jgi:hypothetical protein